ncbi:hypothetical protein JW826_04115 [Candidatus Woesearchaeota archaeon]|nr:hypothetical protein [Candidatus Woesearchaeota archaeon]
MMFRSHTREFLVKAAMHAKHARMKELNHLETELMVAESLLHELRDNDYPEVELLDYNTEIQAIRMLIKERKVRLTME